MVFSDLLRALENIAKTLKNMASDKEFVGMLDYLIANAQPEV